MASSWQWNQVFRSSGTQAICARDTSGGGVKSLLQGSGTSGPDQGSGLVTATTFGRFYLRLPDQDLLGDDGTMGDVLLPGPPRAAST